MPFTIAAAQIAVRAGDLPFNLHRHLQAIQRASALGAHLVIFPELSLTGYELSLASQFLLRPEDDALRPLAEAARSRQITVAAGAPLRQAEGLPHIGAFIYHPDGNTSTYSKVHVHSSEEHAFCAGPGGNPLHIASETVALAICADSSHPSHAAAAAGRSASVYAVGLFITPDAYARKQALLQGYAEQHRMAVVMAGYSGITGGELSAAKSAAWGPDGAMLAQAEDGECLVLATHEAQGWSARVHALPARG